MNLFDWAVASLVFYFTPMIVMFVIVGTLFGIGYLFDAAKRFRK